MQATVPPISTETVVSATVSPNAQEGFIAVAEGVIKSYGYEFSTDARESIVEMIANGMENMGLNPSPGEIMSAHINLVIIVSNLAKQLDTNTSKVEQSTFLNIKKLFCPFPPFWKAPCD